MKKILNYFLIVSLILPLLSSGLSAQEYKLTKQVIGSGGMIGVKNADGITMSGIFAQTAIEKKSTTSLINGKKYDLYQGFWVPDAVVSTGVETGSEFGTEISNYPNPFNSSTTIEYTLTGPSHVILRIYDIVGTQIDVLVNGYQSEGVQTIIWNAKDGNGMDVGTGSYLYELTVRPAGVTGSGFDTYSLRNVMVIVK